MDVDEVDDPLRVALQLREGLAHVLHDHGHELAEKAGLGAQRLAPEADGAPENPAQHIPPPLVARQYTISNKKCG